MKKIDMFLAVFCILPGVLLLSACNGIAAQPVEALAATDTSAEVALPAAADQLIVAAPTETAVVVSPASGRIEFPVGNDRVEVRVVDVKRVFSVYLGQDPVLGTDIRFAAGPGNMFLDVGIKVTNLTGSDIPMKWSEIYMANKHADKWHPMWGGYRETGAIVDPLTIEILKYDRVDPDYDPDAHFYVGDDGFIRVIFQLPRSNLYYFFGFGDLPQVEIKNTYY